MIGSIKKIFQQRYCIPLQQKAQAVECIAHLLIKKNSVQKIHRLLKPSTAAGCTRRFYQSLI